MQKNQNEREEMQIENTYINDINSSGEWARLDHQAALVTEVTGLLPPSLREREYTSVLDVGCGMGRWALDMAFDRQTAMVVGADLSKTMIQYANARARVQGLENVGFDEVDFLKEGELPYVEELFDLIHIRFAVGWVKGSANWLNLLERLFVQLKPGGHMVITEGEGIYTNSLALERLQEIFCLAFHNMGYSLSTSPRFMGVVSQLGHLLSQAGFKKVHSVANVLDYSYYNQDANVAWRNSFHSLINESSAFLINSGATTIGELVALDTQISIDMFKNEFCGMGPLFTFYAQKEEKKEEYVQEVR